MTQLANPLSLARRLYEAGRLEQARQLYEQAIEVEPENLEATYLLGMVHRKLGNFDEAARMLTAAAEIDPRNAAAPFALGSVFLQQGRLNDAMARFRRAIKLDPTLAEAHAGLGAALQRKGRPIDAAESLREAIRLRPHHVEAIVNLGSLHHQHGHLAEAERWYLHALEFQPRHVIALNNLGCLLNECGRCEEAIAHFARAVELVPNSADVLTNMGVAHEALEQHDEARRCFGRACEFAPDNGAAKVRLGGSLLRENATDDALEQFEEALRIDASNLTAWMHQRLALPILYDSIDEIERWRNRYSDGLTQLAEHIALKTAADRAAALRALGSLSNHALLNQGMNDWSLQEKFGRLACRIMAANLPKFASPRPMPVPTDDNRIRIGFASTLMRQHPVGRLVSSFISQLDRTRFKVHCYMLGRGEGHSKRDPSALRDPDDEITERCQAHAARFERPAGAIDAVSAQIARDHLHVLIYPDLGMHPLTVQLGALRLAAVQCAMWGNPTTSGLPSIDYHISSELMEPPGAEEQYTERLITLPNLGVSYPRPASPPLRLTRGELGLPESGTVFMCSQSLPRMLPQFDSLLVRLADEQPQARLVALADPCASITDQYRARLHRAFEQSGLNPERHFIIVDPADRRISPADLLHVCDIVLDAPSWSDFELCAEALSREIPVVTLPGSLMRTRQAYAMLKMLELDELIAADETDYVQIAARLSRDEQFRRRIGSAIALRNSVLFDDAQPVRALEAFLDSILSRAK